MVSSIKPISSPETNSNNSSTDSLSVEFRNFTLTSISEFDLELISCLMNSFVSVCSVTISS